MQVLVIWLKGCQGSGCLQNWSKAQVTRFKGLFSLEGMLFALALTCPCFLNTPLVTEQVPRVWNKAVRADGWDRQTPSKRWQPLAAPGQHPRQPPASICCLQGGRLRELFISGCMLVLKWKGIPPTPATKSQAGLPHIYSFTRKATKCLCVWWLARWRNHIAYYLF